MFGKAFPLASLLLLSGAAAAQAPAVAPIRMNQLGFQPAGPKRAVLPSNAKAPLDWQLLDRSGKVKMRGKTRVFGDAPDAGEHVHQIDFAAFRQEGTGFRVRVGNQESRPFDIKAGLLAPLKYDALAYFYHNRAGVPIDARFAGGAQWARPAGHPKEVAPCFAGKDNHGNVWPGCDYQLDVTGGWYDAGDHGKYVVNGGISLWTLLNLHERQQAKGVAPFADGKAAIPEAGNGVDDLLDHARFEMEFMLAMQVPDGKRAQVPVGQKRPVAGLTFTSIDAGGMAHHKVADERWTGLPTAPHLDPEKRLLFPPSTAATLNLAATAAQCARIWKSIDPAFSARCLAGQRQLWRRRP
jgi:endoglucanase